MTRTSGTTHRVTLQVGPEDPAVDEGELRALGERLARVAHPAVPRLRDVFQLDGRSVQIFDEVGGRTLAALTAERPVPAKAAFEIGARIAGALEAVFHGIDRATGLSLRIRHEALDSGFVFLDRHGAVKLLGIGLGPLTGEPLDGVGSPERVLAQEEGLESDVFALASVLFAAVAQLPLVPPVEDDTLRELMVDPAALRAHLDSRIVAIRDRLGTERGVALLRAMTAARKPDRPTMAQVAARCDLISDSVESAGLSEFARSRVPAAPVETDEGSLSGREVTTTQPSLWSITQTPPPPTPRPASTRRFTPPPASLRTSNVAEPSREPVLGEHPAQAQAAAPATSAEGPMPWSPAETLALFERTPSLAPPRELQPIVVDPLRIPQLLRQTWDDGVARRYKLARMAEQLADEAVDEESDTLVVRDGPSDVSELEPTEPIDVTPSR